MPRFVVLMHETPPGYERQTHFDLMLEQAGALRTWALEELPSGDKAILGERLADHRLQYLDYEGGVSGGRGAVRRVDAGEYVLMHENEKEIVVHVLGGMIRGLLLLQAEGADGQRWRVVLSPA